MIATKYSRTIQNPTHRRMLADLIIREVSEEMRDLGLYIASDDTFDLTDRNEILIINGVGDIGFLPETRSSHRHASMIAAAIHLRDMDGAA